MPRHGRPLTRFFLPHCKRPVVASATFVSRPLAEASPDQPGISYTGIRSYILFERRPATGIIGINPRIFDFCFDQIQTSARFPRQSALELADRNPSGRNRAAPPTRWWGTPRQPTFSELRSAWRTAVPLFRNQPVRVSRVGFSRGRNTACTFCLSRTNRDRSGLGGSVVVWPWRPIASIGGL
jgi:hypothetical protein